MQQGKPGARKQNHVPEGKRLRRRWRLPTVEMKIWGLLAMLLKPEQPGRASGRPGIRWRRSTYGNNLVLRFPRLRQALYSNHANHISSCGGRPAVHVHVHVQADMRGFLAAYFITRCLSCAAEMIFNLHTGSELESRKTPQGSIVLVTNPLGTGGTGITQPGISDPCTLPLP